MTEDRRQSPRHHAAVPAQIETDAGRYTIAITQDVSATGLLVLSHRPLDVGSGVTLHVLIDGVQHEVTGKVVRQEPLAAGESALWGCKAAVVIDEAEGAFKTILSAVTSNQQAR
jgi:hypothetical protein